MPNMSAEKHHLEWAHPLVREWFLKKYGTASKPQALGWPSILAGKHTLISAPTGSGKTFAAFLICIDQLVRKAIAGELTHQTEVLYISPLKALGNDVHKNLMEPLAEIEALANAQNISMSEIRVAVRTGDTLPRERQAMLKKPPHILVTTPESFYLLLTSEKGRGLLAHIKTVIVDEIHAMTDDKRGTHLSLSLERLEALVKNSFVRIGLSATQKPIETVGQFLVGNRPYLPVMINIGYARELDITVEVPPAELSAVASNEMWDEIYNRLAKLTEFNRSTLVFVNTRRLAERVAHHLAERLGEQFVAAHHGSLSRKLRLNAETRLKNGELKILVATASLELGIDIGSIDLVCQLGSPRAIAVALQRIGRAGHSKDAISQGKLFATTRDELIECAALVKAIKEGDLDQLIIPKEPLDILAQQLVAICATGDWIVEDLFNLIKQSYLYKDLTRETFNEVLTMLSEGIAGSRSRYSAYLFHDQINGIVKARRGARITAITSGGAIPENGLFTVIAEPAGVMVGTLDEDFAVESNRGDIILLGTTSWRINRIESGAGKVIVEDAKGAPPSVPFWRGEAPGRTQELSLQVSSLRQKVSDLLSTSDEASKVLASEWLTEHCGLNQSGATQLIEYLLKGRAVLGAVPTQKTIIAERFFDESGGMQLIIHAPFGSRINKAWGLALRKRFCRSFNFELQAAATEDGLNISLLEQHSFPLADVFQFLHPNSIKEVLTQAVLQSPLFTTRFRWDATRALALVRMRNGKKVPPNIQRMLADDLLAAVFPDAAACQDNLAGEDIKLPDHPLINETMKDALQEALDLEGLIELLNKIYSGEITCLAVDTPLPSAFAHEILNANPYAFLDDAPLEERRARAVEMRQVLPESVLKSVGKLDAETIHDVQKQIWPDNRNPDELHDMLQTMIAYPVAIQLSAGRVTQAEWYLLQEELVKANRAYTAIYQGKTFWFAAEKSAQFRALYPEAIIQEKFQEPQQTVDRDDILFQWLNGWVHFLGPFTALELIEPFALDMSALEPILLRIEASGKILRGQFRQEETTLEWCERRILARIHRLTIDKLRKEIEPVTQEQFFQWLLAWQHLAPNTQLKGEAGLLEVIKQLQGYEAPASAWESHLFAKRISDYDRDLLDKLCLTGQVGFGRLSQIQTAAVDKPLKRIRPSSNSPITFFVRDASEWMSQKEKCPIEDNLVELSHAAKNIYTYLNERGASFFPDIVKNVHSLKSEIETGLWELIAVGVVTADSFDNLRALIDPRRRKDKKRRRTQTRFSTGRWSLLQREPVTDSALHMEAVCMMLLKRYGVVFRELLSKEKNIPRWRELLQAFRRLEDRGEIRGGRFITGLVGEQFALPYAISSLRAMRSKAPAAEVIAHFAADPVNISL